MHEQKPSRNHHPICKLCRRMEKLSSLQSTKQHKVPGLPSSDLSVMHKFIPKEIQGCWNSDEDPDQRAFPHCCSCLLNRHVKYYTIIYQFAQMFVLPSSLAEGARKSVHFYSPGIKSGFAFRQILEQIEGSSFSADQLFFKRE